ncbi:MAG: hypothetical protein K2N14_03640, partial [Clostridia bacterium]|nr:hypothetical protein [Clostridia bacterium]
MRKGIIKKILLPVLFLICTALFAVAGCNLFDKHVEPVTVEIDVPYNAQICVNDHLTPEYIITEDLKLTFYGNGNGAETSAQDGKIYIKLSEEGNFEARLEKGDETYFILQLSCEKKSFNLEADQTAATSFLQNLSLGKKVTVPFNVYPADFGDLQIEYDKEYFEVTADGALIPVGVGQSEIKVKAAKSEEQKTFSTSTDFTSSKAKYAERSVESMARTMLGVKDGESITATQFKTIENLARFQVQLRGAEWEYAEDIYPMTGLETIYVSAMDKLNPVNVDPTRYAKLKEVTIENALIGDFTIKNSQIVTAVTLLSVEMTGDITVSNCPALTEVDISATSVASAEGNITVNSINPRILYVKMPAGYSVAVENVDFTATEAEGVKGFKVDVLDGNVALKNIKFPESANVSIRGKAGVGTYDNLSLSNGLWSAVYDELTVKNMTVGEVSVDAKTLYLSAVKGIDMEPVVDGNDGQVLSKAFLVTGNVEELYIDGGCVSDAIGARTDTLKKVYFPDGIKTAAIDFAGCTALTDLSFGVNSNVKNLDVSSTALQGLEFVQKVFELKLLTVKNNMNIIANPYTQGIVEELEKDGTVVDFGYEGKPDFGKMTLTSFEEAAQKLPGYTSIPNVIIKLAAAPANGVEVVVPRTVESLTVKAQNFYCKDVRFVFSEGGAPVEFIIEGEDCV